jgi:hypothetical protein
MVEASGDRYEVCFEPDAHVLMRHPLSRRLAWDLRREQPGGPPSRDGVFLILPRKVRSSPRLKPPVRGGYFWRLARAEP